MMHVWVKLSELPATDDGEIVLAALIAIAVSIVYQLAASRYL